MQKKCIIIKRFEAEVRERHVKKNKIFPVFKHFSIHRKKRVL